MVLFCILLDFFDFEAFFFFCTIIMVIIIIN